MASDRARKQILAKFGKTLRDLRTARGMSQWAVGDAAGLDHNYIGMIERGERNPAVVNVVKIAKALGVSPSELFRAFEK
jgi:transcriptional regulator with XRE-family HTH domain